MEEVKGDIGGKRVRLVGVAQGRDGSVGGGDAGA